MYTDSEHSDSHNSDSDTPQLPTNTFNLFEYISTSPTVTGIKPSEFTEKKYKEILWDAYLQHKNKLSNILEVLFTMNAIQRNLVCKTWTSRRDGGGTGLPSVLKDFFADLKNEQMSLSLLLGMLKNLDELDSEWIHDALYDSNENNKGENDELIIEIICTRTYKQLRELSVSYKKRYSKDLLRDIKLKYRKIDPNFVKMCDNLLNGEREENVLITPQITQLTNDIKLFNDSLSLNKIPNTVLSKMSECLTHRSWRHIHDLCPVYAQLCGYNLQTSLSHKLPKNKPSNIAMINIVEISRSIHLYFAHRLRTCLSTKSNNKSVIAMLHRIILSRCEVDLGAIFLLFASKESLSDNKTMRQWILERVPRKKQPIHQQILLFLCGLPQNESYGNDDMLKTEEKSSDSNESVFYAINYDEYIGSVTGVMDKQFKPELDVQSIMNWIHPIQDGEATKDERKKLKDRMAKLLCNRNSNQRHEIDKLFMRKHKSSIMDYLRLIFKKGQSLKICEYLLQTIAGCNCAKLKQCVDAKNINGISDVLCTNNPVHLREIVQTYGSDLTQELEDTCTRQKKQTLWRIWNKLLSKRRFQEFGKNSALNMGKLKQDLQFLTNFKKSKFKLKEEQKKKFVDIFVENSQIYLRALNIQFQQTSHEYNLIYLIDKVLGIKLGSGYAIKVLLSYSINQSEYFSKKVYDLGRKNWKKYEEEISFVFISRSEIDLYSIQLAFHNNLYANGQVLTQWVSEKTNESKTGLFLVLLLQSLAKNKNPEQQARYTLRAHNGYSNAYTPRIDSDMPHVFGSAGQSSVSHTLTLGNGPGQLQLTKNINNAMLSPKKSFTEEYHIHDSYEAVVENKSEKSKQKESKPTKTEQKKVSEIVVVEEPKIEKIAPAAVVTPVTAVIPSVDSRKVSVTNKPITPAMKIKKLSVTARQEMAKKIVNTLTQKVKLSEIDIKNKNNKIEPDELFDFLKKKEILVPRYISNVVFADIDMNSDGHITMFEYFKWKSKVSVVKMFDILPERVPDIDDDDSYYFEEGITSEAQTAETEAKTANELVDEEESETTNSANNHEIRVLEDKLVLYKKLLNLTIRNKDSQPLNRNIFSAYCNRNDFGLNKAQIYRIFSDMDYDRDGKISANEYFKWRDTISMGYLNDLLSQKTDTTVETAVIHSTLQKITPIIEEKTVTDYGTNNAPIIDETELSEISPSPYSKSDYLLLKTQISILVNESSKKWSLFLLDWNDSFNAKMSFLSFVSQYLDSKIVTQLFKRFGTNNIVGSDGFAELLTFTYTLYRAKLQRQFYANEKSFKKMKNNEVRPKIEHFVIWVIRTFGKELTAKTHSVCIANPKDSSADEIEIGEFNEYEFRLTMASYTKDLAVWIKEYIHRQAAHEDIETAWMILMIWLE